MACSPSLRYSRNRLRSRIHILCILVLASTATRVVRDIEGAGTCVVVLLKRAYDGKGGEGVCFRAHAIYFYWHERVISAGRLHRDVKHLIKPYRTSRLPYTWGRTT